MSELTTHDSRLLDLLVAWEDARQKGQTLGPEQLCPDDAELRAALAARIAQRERMQAAFDLPEATYTVANTAPRAEQAPPKLEGYEIIDVLGRGGMGVVYRARDLALGRMVAIKMILSGAAASPSDLQRFRTEAEAVARLRHPHIVQIYAVGEHAGCPYLVLELLEGGSLAREVAGTPLPARRAAEMLLALADAVAHAHHLGILHRDLKPANVLLADPRTPKIADFGLAKRIDSDLGHTETGTVMGSPCYMAPEQAEGRTRDIGPASDIYALGAILYEMLTGGPPFRADTMLETLEMVRHNDPVPPRVLLPKLPADLEAICLKCLEKRPQLRYASADDLAADLRRFLDGEPVHARSASFLDQVTQAIRHHGIDAKFQGMARLTWLLSPIPVLVHTVAFFALRGYPDHPYWMIAISLALAFLLQGVMLAGKPEVMRSVQRRQRRHAMTIWTSHMFAMIMTGVVVWVFMPPREPRDIFVLYPLWLIITAITLLSMAAEAGLLYISGCGCYVAVALATLLPDWSPLFVGLFMTFNISLNAFFLGNLGRPS